jgi:predicted dehydrogenase
MPKQHHLTRREVIQSTAGTFAIPMIVPEGVIGRKGRQGANDRIVIANIGVGGMGSNHIYPDSAALCDVDESRLAAAAKKVTVGTPSLYTDFRRVLDRKDIDAVTSGTPDHWHAHIAVMAVQAGKHVYTEKPTARTIGESRAMLNASRYYNRVIQVGAQGRSHPNAHAACQFIRNGGIGKLERVEILHPDNPTTTEYGGEKPVPAGLNWDLWLGPARWREYNHHLHPARFRWFMEFGGGQIRDRGNHALSIASWLTGLDDFRGVVTCEARGDAQLTGCYDVPLNFDVTWRFEGLSWTLHWKQMREVPKTHAPWGATYAGSADTLIVTQGDGACNTEEKAKRYVPPPGGEVYLHPASRPDIPTTDRHRENWLWAIRTGKRPAMDIEFGHRTVTLCNLSNIAWQLGRPVKFDFSTEQFVGDEEADRFIHDSYREPWRLY